MKKLSILFSVILLLMSSCQTQKEVTYFQDLRTGEIQEIDSKGAIRMEPNDQISIIVTCKDPELTALYNLVSPQNYVGTAGQTSYNAGRVSYYTIDEQGYIDFPVLGQIYVAGMTRQDVAYSIKEKLTETGQITDPVVVVEFANLAFSVLGEVKSAGKYLITKNKTTILEALSMAGDLNITGLRTPIYVIREEGDKRITYALDLKSKNVFKSPAYYVKQNDIIYVRPNKMRAGQSTINENTLGSINFWMSVGSFLMSLGILIFK